MILEDTTWLILRVSTDGLQSFFNSLPISACASGQLDSSKISDKWKSITLGMPSCPRTRFSCLRSWWWTPWECRPVIAELMCSLNKVFVEITKTSKKKGMFLLVILGEIPLYLWPFIWNQDGPHPKPVIFKVSIELWDIGATILRQNLIDLIFSGKSFLFPKYFNH